jgi:hypothetical protein
VLRTQAWAFLPKSPPDETRLPCRLLVGRGFRDRNRVTPSTATQATKGVAAWCPAATTTLAAASRLPVPNRAGNARQGRGKTFFRVADDPARPNAYKSLGKERYAFQLWGQA